MARASFNALRYAGVIQLLFLNWTPRVYLIGAWIGEDQRHMFKRDWTMPHTL